MLNVKTIAIHVAFILFFSFELLSTELNSPMKILYDFNFSSKEPKWTAQNDSVMGGVSSGKAEINNEYLYFTGNLSLENNGGFAQIYSITELSDFSKFSAIRLRVKGDGRVYQFRLATDARFRGSRIAYRSNFKTEPEQWSELSIPFNSMEPSFRGRLLSTPPINLKSVQRVAFLLADGISGPFSLQVEWIGLE